MDGTPLNKYLDLTPDLLNTCTYSYIPGKTVENPPH